MIMISLSYILVRYPCDQYDYIATRSGILKRHKESKYKGVRYPCDQFDHIATQSGDLKSHKERKHERV